MRDLLQTVINALLSADADAVWGRPTPDETITAGCDRDHTVVGLIKSDLDQRRVEALPPQPGIMRVAPGLTARVDDPMAQQQFRQPMPPTYVGKARQAPLSCNPRIVTR